LTDSNAGQMENEFDWLTTGYLLKCVSQVLTSEESQSLWGRLVSEFDQQGGPGVVSYIESAFSGREQEIEQALKQFKESLGIGGD